MGKRTVLWGENMTLTTGINVLAAFQTAAAGAAAAIVKATRIEISQSGSTTLGMLRPMVSTRNTAGTFTLTSQAPTAVEPVGGAASGIAGSTAPAGGTARSGINCTVDSGGSYTDLFPLMAEPNISGVLWKPDPKEELLVPASTLIVVRFKADPQALTGWTIAWYLEEL